MVASVAAAILQKAAAALAPKKGEAARAGGARKSGRARWGEGGRAGKRAGEIECIWRFVPSINTAAVRKSVLLGKRIYCMVLHLLQVPARHRCC